MSKLMDQFNKSQLIKIPEIRPGDDIKVHQKIKDGNKERIQIFEGIVIARKHGKGISATITVRKIVEGVGVERVFPVYSPAIAKIEVVKSAKVRRAKLYYLRTAKGKKSRLKKKEFAAAIVPEEPVISETPETIEASADEEQSSTEVEQK